MSTNPQGSEIFASGDMAEVASATLNVGDAAYYTHSSPDKTTSNEDSIGVLQINDDVAALILADGLGGYRAGDQASKAAIDALFKALRNHDSESSLRATVLNGLEDANRRVLEVGGGAATTIVTAIISGKTVRIYHIGDSGALLVGQRGAERLRTIAHSPVGQAEASGLIDEEMALAHESRHLVSNVLGSNEMRIEVGSAITLARFDTLLLASDGLLDNLRIAEIIEIIRKGPLDEVARELKSVITSRMKEKNDGQHPSKPDDLSFILFRRNQ